MTPSLCHSGATGGPSTPSDCTDVFVGRETAEGLEPAREVVGRHEVREVGAELIVAVVVVTFD